MKYGNIYFKLLDKEEELMKNKYVFIIIIIVLILLLMLLLPLIFGGFAFNFIK